MFPDSFSKISKTLSFRLSLEVYYNDLTYGFKEIFQELEKAEKENLASDLQDDIGKLQHIIQDSLNKIMDAYLTDTLTHDECKEKKDLGAYEYPFFPITCNSKYLI